MKLVSIINRFRLGDEKESAEYVTEQVTNGIEFKGTNLIILIFAIFIASIGLNINSTAVIIGAMLISPLMGPIIGVGYALATYDTTLLRRSIKNYSFAIFTSLAASTVYFAMSPLNEAHSELLARTTPTIYDVLIALFGGFAGIVATASKKKGNVIPGVAIATALMPPLCTAGYGIATANWNYLFGALYLFTINSVFIAVSTMLFSRFLKFPIHRHSTEEKIKKSNRWVTAIVVITVLPSIFLGYKLVVQDQFRRAAMDFVDSQTELDNSYLLHSKIDPAERQIVLVFGGKQLTDEQKEKLKEKLSYFHIEDANLIIKQGFKLESESKQTQKLEKYFRDIKKLENINRHLMTVNDSLLKMHKYSKEINQRIFRELKTFYPKLNYLFIFDKEYESDSVKKKLYYVFIDDWKAKIKYKKLKQWLTRRLDADSVYLVIESK
jgi:uncharacterized hydrophobic protein (TIGR00271 family)